MHELPSFSECFELRRCERVVGYELDGYHVSGPMQAK